MSVQSNILPTSLQERVEVLAAEEDLSVEEFIRLAVAEKAAVLELGHRAAMDGVSEMHVFTASRGSQAPGG